MLHINTGPSLVNTTQNSFPGSKLPLAVPVQETLQYIVGISLLLLLFLLTKGNNSEQSLGKES